MDCFYTSVQLCIIKNRKKSWAELLYLFTGTPCFAHEFSCCTITKQKKIVSLKYTRMEIDTTLSLNRNKYEQV